MITEENIWDFGVSHIKKNPINIIFFIFIVNRISIRLEEIKIGSNYERCNFFWVIACTDLAAHGDAGQRHPF